MVYILSLTLSGSCSLDSKVVYRRYASLFFVCGISSSDNELVTLEIIHRYVEVLDRYFGNVRSVFLQGCCDPKSAVAVRSVSLTCEFLGSNKHKRSIWWQWIGSSTSKKHMRYVVSVGRLLRVSSSERCALVDLGWADHCWRTSRIVQEICAPRSMSIIFEYCSYPWLLHGRAGDPVRHCRRTRKRRRYNGAHWITKRLDLLFILLDLLYRNSVFLLSKVPWCSSNYSWRLSTVIDRRSQSTLYSMRCGGMIQKANSIWISDGGCFWRTLHWYPKTMNVITLGKWEPRKARIRGV